MRHLFVVAALICGSVVSLPAQSLREAARKFGGAADNSYNAEFQLRPWDELVAKSDMIVRARISGVRTLLVEKEALVATEYQFVPLQMIRQIETQRSATRPGGMPPLIVRRIGGRMVEGSYRYSTRSPDFPESSGLKVGDEAVPSLINLQQHTGRFAPVARTHLEQGTLHTLAFHLAQDGLGGELDTPCAFITRTESLSPG